MEEQGEQQKNRKSMMITGAIQVVLLLVFYLLVAWKEPNPPIPEYGVELSFGVATGGSNLPPQEQAVTTPAPVEPEVVEPQETPATAEEAAAPAAEESIEEVPEGDLPIEESGQPEASTEEAEDVSTQETTSDQQAEETLEETATPAAPAVSQPEAVEEEQAVVASENSDSESIGQGNDAGDEVQGEPAAEIDTRALYGNVTGQEGASLQMSGWVWDFEPTPQDDSEESGKIVYKVTIDDEGYIIKVIPQTSTVSPSVEKYYRQAVERLTFSKTSSYKPAPTSTGTITFIIKTK